MKAKTIFSYYVYIITNTLLNKQYVGSRVCYKEKIEDDLYWGSSKNLKRDYKLYGMENFTKEILSFADNKKDLLDNETDAILKFNTLSPIGYNLFLPNAKYGFHMLGTKASQETKDKMRLSHVGVKKSEETKNKIKEKRKLQVFSNETKEKMKNSHKDIEYSQETKDKKRNSMLGKNTGKYVGIKLTPEQLEKRKLNKINIDYDHKN